MGMFIANLLTVDAITQTQLQGMDEDNPYKGGNLNIENLSDQEQRLMESSDGRLMLFRLRGPLSFGAAKGISSRMGLVNNCQVLILDITEVPRMGVTAALAVERMVQEAQSLGRVALVAGANQRLKERLRRFGVNAVMRNRLDALRQASKHLSQNSVT